MRLFALCAASVEGLASEKWYTGDTDGTDRPDGIQKTSSHQREKVALQ